MGFYGINSWSNVLVWPASKAPVRQNKHSWSEISLRKFRLTELALPRRMAGLDWVMDLCDPHALLSPVPGDQTYPVSLHLLAASPRMRSPLRPRNTRIAAENWDAAQLVGATEQVDVGEKNEKNDDGNMLAAVADLERR